MYYTFDYYYQVKQFLEEHPDARLASAWPLFNPTYNVFIPLKLKRSNR